MNTTIKNLLMTLSKSFSLNANIVKIGFALLLSLAFTACGSSSSGGGSSVSGNTSPLRLSPTAATVEEGNSLTFTVSRIGNNTAERIDFEWNISLDNDNKNTLDFVGNTKSSGNIAIGVTTADIIINTFNDGLYEGPNGEEFSLIVRATDSGSILENFRILDDGDTTPNINVSLLSNSQALNTACPIISYCEGGLVAFRVELSEISGINTNFSWNVIGEGGLLEVGTNLGRGNTTIPAGAKYIDINFSSVEDTIYKGTKNHEFRLSGLENAIISGGATTDIANVSIVDSLPAPAVSVEGTSRTEEGGNLVFPVDIGTAVEGDVILNWRVTDGKDLVDTTTGIITIASGGTTGTITIDTIGNTDTDSNPVNNIMISIVVDTNTGSASLFDLNSINVGGEITDYVDNANNFIYTENGSYRVNEGQNFSINVVISTTDTENVTFNWVASSSGYQDVTGEGTIPSGNTSTSINFSFADNGLYGSSATGSFTISNIGGGRKNFELGSAAGLNIQNISPLPSASFAAVSQSVSRGEASGDISFRLELDRGSLLPTQVSYRVELTDASDDDFGNLDATSVIFSPRQTATDITLSITDDDIYEGNESFNIYLINALPANIGTSNRASGTIIDNETLPQLTITTTTPSINEGETAIYTVSAGSTTSIPITFDWNLAYDNISTSDLAANNNDFIEYRGSGIIRVGETETTIELEANDDNIYEVDEKFRIVLSNVVGAVTTTTTTSVINTINLDANDNPTISFVGNGATQQEGTVFNFTLMLDKVIERELQASWELLFTGLTNPATLNDFDVTNGVVTFAANSINSRASFSVTTVNDNIYDGTELENFQAQVTQFLNSTPSPSVISAVQVIRDDADNPNAVLSIASNSPSNVVEGNSIGVIVTNFDGKSVNSDIEFGWEIDFANSTADAADFSGVVNGSATINSGSSTTTVNITTASDSNYELPESFVFAITSVSDGNFTGSPDTATITITDPNPPTISVAVSGNGNFNESSKNAVFIVSLTSESATPIPFNWSVNTAEGLTNAEAIDVSSTSGSGSIAASETRTEIRVGINNDNIYEANETFSLTISGFSNDLVNGTLTSAATIINDDQQPVVQVLDISGREGDGIGDRQETLNIVIDYAGPTLSSVYPVNVNWLIDNGTAIRGEAYEIDATSGTATIAALATTTDVTVTIISDDTSDIPETFTIDLTGLVNSDATISSSNNSATATILDDDGISGTLASGVTVLEGSSANFTLSIDSVALAGTVTWEVTTDSAGVISAGLDDFVSATGSINVTNVGDYPINIGTVAGVDDIYEGNETFTLIVSDSLGEIARTVGTIMESVPVLSIPTLSGNIVEGAPQVIVVAINKPSVFLSPFSYSITGGELSNFTNLTSLTNNTSSIAIGDTTTSITLQTRDDSVIGDKTFSFSVSNTNSRSTGTPSANFTVYDNDNAIVISGPNRINERATGVYTISVNDFFDTNVTLSITGADIADYRLSSNSVTVSRGNDATVSIEAVDDSVYEYEEVINLRADIVSNSRTNNQDITIEEIAPTLSIAPLSGDIIEGESQVIIATISEPSLFETSFSLNIGGDVIVGDDFARIANNPILAGNTTTDIILETRDDNDNETNESFSIMAVSLDPTRSTGSPTANFRILDNDSPIGIAGSTTINEGDTNNYTISVNDSVSTNVTLSITGAQANDYRLSTTSVTLVNGGNETVSIEAVNDDVYEEDETITLVAVASGGRRTTRNITISDMLPTLTISSTESNINEIAPNNSTTINVTLSEISELSTNFSYQISGISESDISSNLTGVISISAGARASSFIIDAINDDSVGNKQFTVELTNATNATIASLGSVTVNIIDDDGTFRISGAATIQEGSTADYIITTDAVVDKNINITIRRGTNVSASDYNIYSTSSTINTTSNDTVEITVANDNIYEANESITLVITDSNDRDNSTEFPINIINTTALPEISIAPNTESVLEGFDFTFNVSTTGDISLETSLSLNYSVSRGSGTVILTAEPEDFVGLNVYPSRSFSLNADGVNDPPIIFGARQDKIYETDESFLLTITGARSAVTATGTIGNITDEPRLIITGESSANEGEPIDWGIRVENTNAVESSTLPIHYSYGYNNINDTITGVRRLSNGEISNIVVDNGASTTALSGNGIFNYESSTDTQEIRISTLPDNIYEEREYLSLRIFDASNAIITNSTTSFGNNINTLSGGEGVYTVFYIEDLTPLPSLSITSASANVNENAGTIEFTVTRNGASEVDATFDYNTNDGSAVSPGDYIASSDTNVISPAANSISFSIRIIDDNIYEGNETFVMSISNPIGATLDTANASVSVTIVNSTPFPTISLTPNSASGNEGESIDFTASIPSANQPEVDIIFDYTVGGTGSNPATLEDFGSAFPNGTITLGSSATSSIITLNTATDLIYEANQGFRLNVSGDSLVNGSDTPISASANGTIINITPAPQLAITGGNTVTEGTTITWGFRIENNTLVTSSELPIKYSYSYNTDTSSGARSINNIDIVDINGISNNFSGNTMFNYTSASTANNNRILTRDDIVYEGPEYLSLRIFDASNAEFSSTGNSIPITFSNGTSTTFLYINDDESAPTLSIADSSNDENNSQIVFTVTRNGASELPSEFRYSTANGTAMAGLDYTAVVNSISSIPASTSSIAIIDVRIPIINDSIFESDETLNITISDPVNATIATATATGTIRNTTALTGFTVSSSNPGNFDINEGSNITVTVGFASLGTTVNLNYVVTGSGSNPASISDFSGARSGTVELTETNPMQTFTITAATDTIYEASQGFTITLSGSDITETTRSGNITNQTPVPELVITGGNAVTENGTINWSFGVQNNSSVTSSELPIRYSYSYNTDTSSGARRIDNTEIVTINGTANNFSGNTMFDYTSASITNNSTIVIGNDNIYEGTEYLSLKVFDASNAEFSSTGNSIPITFSNGTSTTFLYINDDETAPTLSIADASAGEDSGEILFTVTRNGASELPAEFRYSTANGTAIAGLDYTAVVNSISSIPASTSPTATIAVNVPITNDSIFESDETLNITISDPVNATIATATATGTIRNTTALTGFSVTSNTGSFDINEGSVITVSVGFASLLTGVDINYEVTGDGIDPASITDFSVNSGYSGTISLSSTAPNKTFTITTTADTIYETDKSFTITLSGSDITETTRSGNIINQTPIPRLSVSGDGYINEGGTLMLDLEVENNNLVTSSELPIRYSYSYNNPSDSTSDLNRLSNNEITSITIDGVSTTSLSGNTTFNYNSPDDVISNEIAILDDTDIIYEGREYLSLRIFDASDAVIDTIDLTMDIKDVFIDRLNNPSGIYFFLSIDDNEPAPVLNITSASADESDGRIVFTVTKTGASAVPAFFSYTVGSLSGSASEGTDYTPIAISDIAIAPSEVSAEIEVIIFNDGLYENDETFNVVIANPRNATLSGGSDSLAVLGTIRDSLPGVSVSAISPTNLMEGEDIKFRVSFGIPIAFDGIIRAVSSGDGVIDSSIDKTVLAGATFVDWTFRSSPSSGIYSADSHNVEFIIMLSSNNIATSPIFTINQQTPELRLNPQSFSLIEGGTVTYSLVLANTSVYDSIGNTVSLSYTLTTNSGSDLTVNRGGNYNNLFDGNQLTVMAVDDAVSEPEETYTITASNISLGGNLVDTTTATITIPAQTPPVPSSFIPYEVVVTNAIDGIGGVITVNTTSDIRIVSIDYDSGGLFSIDGSDTLGGGISLNGSVASPATRNFNVNFDQNRPTNSINIDIVVEETVNGTTTTDTTSVTLSNTYNGELVNVYNATQLANMHTAASDFNRTLCPDCIGYQLVNDITLDTNSSWNPIGTPGDKFSLTFDGNGNEISGLTITSDDLNAAAGLFGSASNATIRDLTLDINSIDVITSTHIGALVGDIENSTIDNIGVISDSYDTIAKVNVREDANAGALVSVGTVVGFASNTSINDIKNQVGVTFLVNTLSTFSERNSGKTVGGIIGRAENSSLAKLRNIGIVYVTSTTASADTYAGGIAGALKGTSASNKSTLTQSYSAANIINQSGGRVGGLVGYLYNFADITTSWVAGVQATSGSKFGAITGTAFNNITVDGVFVYSAPLRYDGNADNSITTLPPVNIDDNLLSVVVGSDYTVDNVYYDSVTGYISPISGAMSLPAKNSIGNLVIAGFEGASGNSFYKYLSSLDISEQREAILYGHLALSESIDSIDNARNIEFSNFGSLGYETDINVAGSVDFYLLPALNRRFCGRRLTPTNNNQYASREEFIVEIIGATVDKGINNTNDICMLTLDAGATKISFEIGGITRSWLINR